MSFSAKSRRRGAEILELVLVLPILFLVLAGGVQFASVVSVDASICHASLEASRLCAMGCEASEISDSVDQFLGIHGMTLASGTRLVIEDASGVISSVGDSSLLSPVIGSPVPANSCRAILLVDTDASPIPNALRDYCVDFSGKQFEHVSLSCLPACDCR